MRTSHCSVLSVSGPLGGSVGQVERAMNLLRRVLQYQVSVGALIEVALWLAVPYLAIGFVWAMVHAEQTQRIQERLDRVLLPQSAP